jgi:predicted outer membrane repeat protein
MRNHQRLGLLVITAMVSAASFGGTLYVDDSAVGANNGTSWTDAYLYLQDALGFAIPGDTIRVAQGIYRPDQSAYLDSLIPGDRKASFHLKSGVTILGGYVGADAPTGRDPDMRDHGRNWTVLSGDLQGNDSTEIDLAAMINAADRQDNSIHVVVGTGTDSTAVLDGFTITGGNANIPGDDGEWVSTEYGGGLYNGPGNCTVRDCLFGGNSATAGGAVYNRDGSQPSFLNCWFRGNVYNGMYNDTQSSPVLEGCVFEDHSRSAVANYNQSNPVLTNCQFRRNGSENEFGGGIIAGGGSCPVVQGCVFEDNFSGQRGGALYCADKSDAVVSDSVFRRNRGTWYGGAVFSELSRPVFRRCVFEDNESNSGGAISVGNWSWYEGAVNDVTIENCLFTLNRAVNHETPQITIPGRGGAISAEIWQQNRLTVTNCTFAGNTAPTARAIFCDSFMHNSASEVRVINCILWDGGNEAASQDKTVIGIRYSDIQGGFAGEGNKSIDPLFVNATSGDYRLKSQAGRWDPTVKQWAWDSVTSPCIDAGDPAIPVGDEPAPNGGRINMGFDGGTTTASKSWFGGESVASFQGLGSLPGGVNSEARAVSADGSAVVGSSNTATKQQGYLWTVTGGMTPLPRPVGLDMCWAGDISADGRAVSGWGGSSFSTAVGWEGILWKDGAVADRLALPGTGILAGGISGDGKTLIGSMTTVVNNQVMNRAFLWTQEGGYFDLGGLVDPGSRTTPYAISQDGKVVTVECINDALGTRTVFYWSAGTGVVPLDGVFTAAALSRDGSVIVGTVPGTSMFQAFRWTAADGVVPIDTPIPDHQAHARGVSGDGSIVVGFIESNQDETRDAFIWDASHGMRILQDLLETEYGVNLAGWRLLVAWDISDDGTTIVGRGLNPQGAEEAWRVVLPNRTPVFFADANLKVVVETALGVSNPTVDDIKQLTQLSARSKQISNLTGLEYATQLKSLDLKGNQIEDLGPLAFLSKLESVELGRNRIVHIAPLEGLVNVKEMDLDENQISDIFPLTRLTGLDELELQNNPLNRRAYCQDLQTIRDNNPGIVLSYDENPSAFAGDFNRDCQVDLNDLILLAKEWLQSDCGSCQADGDSDGRVTLADFAILSRYWLSD